ncbi:MAG TPA: class I SAM-dependent methyltransferase [Bacteroidales bacterium]|nr:class I SAM-dependent methyltransferase [Bacteroidales bacterium]
MERHYDPGYYGHAKDKFRFPGVEKVMDHFRTRRAARIHRLLGGQGRILDIGCGSGRFLHLLSARGNYSLLGSELPGPAAERARRFPEIQLSTTGNFHEQATPGSLDAVTLFHVVEHLPDPVSVLKNIHLALRPGGYLYLSFPNIYSLQGRWSRGHWLHLDPPRHLILFHPSRFMEKLGELGFNCISRRGLSLEQNPFGMVQSLLNRWGGRRDLLFESFKGNKEYTRRSTRATLLAHRLFFIITFPVFAVSDLLLSPFRLNATVTFVFRRQENPDTS